MLTIPPKPNDSTFNNIGQFFGTDGIRGVANYNLTIELALAIGSATARSLGNLSKRYFRRIAVVGRDTRVSGDILKSAIISGITSEGIDVIWIGIIPTPAVAYLTKIYNAAFGIMISASHNPMLDNGIKIFGPGGYKLNNIVKKNIEKSICLSSNQRSLGSDIGRVYNDKNALSCFLQHAKKAVTTKLNGITVVVDCAHGAAHLAAPWAYKSAGANVIKVNGKPNGININNYCGSTHMEILQSLVVKNNADLGLAHDGDGDRCIAVNSLGDLIDGDSIMLVLALAMQKSGELLNDTLVVTTMSNLGLHLAMKSAGIKVHTTCVGDSSISEELYLGQFALGGEQSGHIILPAISTTGDGIITGLKLMSIMAETNNTLKYLVKPMRTIPQIVINVIVDNKNLAIKSPLVKSAILDAEVKLNGIGRFLLRPSGTEEVIRVMVESDNTHIAQKVAKNLAASISYYSGK